jgi:hypothetical protein
MDRRIFELGLSVEAISLYLIMADLESSAVPLTHGSPSRPGGPEPERSSSRA